MKVVLDMDDFPIGTRVKTPSGRIGVVFKHHKTSMPPVVHGSYVVGEFVQDWLGLPSAVPCVIVTKDDGIVFKYLHNNLKNSQSFTLASTNPLYEPYEVHVSEVLEIWRFVSYISRELPDVQLDHASIGAGLRSIQEDLQKVLQLRK